MAFLFKNKSKKNQISIWSNCSGSFIEGYNKIAAHTVFPKSHMGLGSYIGSNCYLPHCYIGRFSSIGNNVTIIVGNHPSRFFVSTNPAFFDTKSNLPLGRSKTHFDEFAAASSEWGVIIRNDVWIGNNVQIKQGVTIGDGAIIGFGSIVTKDVLPYTVVAGNPASIIRKRFEDQQIITLLGMAWWNWPLGVIIQRRDDFSNIADFIGKYKRN